MKKKRNAVILWKKRNNYGKNVMVGTSVTIIVLYALGSEIMIKCTQKNSSIKFILGLLVSYGMWSNLAICCVSAWR